MWFPTFHTRASNSYNYIHLCAFLQAHLDAAWEDSDTAADEADRVRGQTAQLRAELDVLTTKLEQIQRSRQAAQEVLRHTQEDQLRHEMVKERRVYLPACSLKIVL